VNRGRTGRQRHLDGAAEPGPLVVRLPDEQRGLEPIALPDEIDVVHELAGEGRVGGVDVRLSVAAAGDGNAPEIEMTLAAHREWVAAGRPGAVSHVEAMAELLADS
jgi:hypothetical protein